MKSEQYNSKQKAYFQSADQPTILPVETPYVIRHIENLISYGNLNTEQKILEVGAGIGRFSHLLSGQGLDITASDISPELISSLQKLYPNMPSFVSDVSDIPTEHHGKFDVVLGFFMLHHLQDLAKAFKSMATALKPGGQIIFCEPNAWFFPFYLQIILTPRMRWQVDKGVMNMRQGILDSAFKKSGFSSISYSHYGFFPPQLYNRSWGKYLDNALDKTSLPACSRAFQIIRAYNDF